MARTRPHWGRPLKKQMIHSSGVSQVVLALPRIFCFVRDRVSTEIALNIKDDITRAANRGSLKKQQVVPHSGRTFLSDPYPVCETLWKEGIGASSPVPRKLKQHFAVFDHRFNGFDRFSCNQQTSLRGIGTMWNCTTDFQHYFPSRFLVFVQESHSVAILLRQEAYRTCISSSTSIDQCLVSVGGFFLN